MSSLTTFSENVKVFHSHIRVVITPEVVESTWASISSLGDQVVECLKDVKHPSCLVDLTQLDFMGSSLVALIVRIWREVKSRNGRLVVVTSHPIVKETISLAGLDKIWDIQPSIELGSRALDLSDTVVAEVEGREVVIERSGIGRYERLVWVSIVLTLVLILGISIFVMMQNPS
ncbi:STAS domain-containing protein [Thalassoglobus sp. JC818]|uniref:STAS domain-containing protein n=1 Tax=Thalassoglobus sp. JC818 TaxID=3232136 RepID=UPI003459CBC5